MEKAFEDLRRQGKNDVASLVKWLQDSQIIDHSLEAEKKARALFNDVVNKNNVELAKFKEVVEKLALEKKSSLDNLSKKLELHSAKFLGDIEKAFGEAFGKK